MTTAVKAMPGWRCPLCHGDFAPDEMAVPVARPVRALVSLLPDGREEMGNAQVTGYAHASCATIVGAGKP